MATVLLLRHGRTTANADGGLAGRQPVELDDTGRAPGRSGSASGCAPLPLAAVVTSPLIRCRQTLELALPGVEPVVEDGPDRVRVRRLGGPVRSRTLAKDPLWPVVQQHPSAVVFPNGEAMAAMSARAVAAVRRLGRPGHRRARPGRGLAGVQPRRCDQGDRGRRDGSAPGPVPADRGRPGVGDRRSGTPRPGRSCCASTTPAVTWPRLVPPPAARRAGRCRPDESTPPCGGGRRRGGVVSDAP